MINSIKHLFGMGSKADYKQLVKEGALILDVRSKGEFESGHIRSSINIPVDQLQQNLNKLRDKHQPIITCCASGIRSAAAKRVLLSEGFTKVFNGGGWNSLQNKL